MKINKKSIVGLIQVLNAVVSVLIIIYLAKKITTEQFAIIAMYNIITGFYASITFFGNETQLLRNTLRWEKTNRNRLYYLCTSAISARVLISLMLIFPVGVYAYYIFEFHWQYDNKMIIPLFLLGGMSAAILNGCGLIIKSFNNHLMYYTVTIVITLFGKIIGAFLISEQNFEIYLYCVILAVVCAAVCAYYVIRNYVRFKYSSLKIKKTFRRNKFFIASGHINYYKLNIDQIVFSTLIDASLLATYNLVRKLEETLRGLIAVALEPGIQRLTGMRNKALQIIGFKKIKRTSTILVVLYVFLVPLIIGNVLTPLIEMLQLGKFEFLTEYVYCAAVIAPIYIFYKLNSYYTYLFLDSRTLFKIDVVTAITAICCLAICLMFLPQDFLYLNRVFIAILSLVILKILTTNKSKGINEY